MWPDEFGGFLSDFPDTSGSFDYGQGGGFGGFSGLDPTTVAGNGFDTFGMPPPANPFASGNGFGGLPSLGGLSNIFGSGAGLASLFGLVSPVLGGAIDAVRQGDASKDMMNFMNGQMNKVDNLYAPNSPEYNALWDQMSRMDAASGRNSQYGPRSVDLAAKIAPMRAQNTIGITNALARPYGDTLRQNAGKYAGLFNSLGNLFSPFTKAMTPAPTMQGGGGGDGGFGDILGAVGSIIGFL
jgi:hypothetical protein